jgi:hypothetical protein
MGQLLDTLNVGAAISLYRGVHNMCTIRLQTMYRQCTTTPYYIQSNSRRRRTELHKPLGAPPPIAPASRRAPAALAGGGGGGRGEVGMRELGFAPGVARGSDAQERSVFFNSVHLPALSESSPMAGDHYPAKLTA